MSSIVLSAATRSSLLAAQGTADMMATTQERLSTGKKVNSALDNPTNFFTAAGLDGRASDLSDLLDGISNGVQTIQAANQGITSIQKLVDQARSLANQALQTSAAYSAKASAVSAAITGATATNLSGTYAAVSVTAASAVNNDNTTAVGISAATKLTGPAGTSSTNGLSSKITTTDTLTVNGKTITFAAGSVPAAGSIPAGSGSYGNIVTDGSGNSTVYIGDTTTGVASMQDVMDAMDIAAGNKSVSISGTTANVSLASGATAASITGGQLSVSTGTAQDLVLAGTALAKIGLTPATTARTPPTGTGTINVSVGTGTAAKALSLTIGTGTGAVNTLDDLNAKLNTVGAQALLDSTGRLTITTTNDSGGDALSVSGSLVGVSGKPFTGTGTTPTVSSTPAMDGDGLTTRSNLAKSYNALLSQIDQLAKDASFNGVNLLNGDLLKLTFNERNTSSLSIQGIDGSSAGIGLTAIQDADFQDTGSINSVLSTIQTVTNGLRSQAAALGSNLTVVQNRQDFSKNLINVLQTGSAHLVNADLNEEAANSQALSTRQSLSISALSLANQAQQGVLKLLQ